MDHDAPEREVLNAYETRAIVGMHLRLFFRKRDELNRVCGKAAESMRSFGKAMHDAFPMDDWDDDCIAECCGR